MNARFDTRTWTLRRVSALMLAAGAVLATFGLLAAPQPVAAQSAQKDLMETIRSDARFSMLVRAVEAADLVDTLKSPGPYTFFAPTNDAFNKIDPGTLDALLKDREMLRRLLQSHLSPGYLTAAQAVQVPTIPNALGDPIAVNVSGASVFMNSGRVTEPDLRASNGVIHVVDTVWTKESLSPNALPVAGVAEDASQEYAVIGAALLAAGLAVTRLGRRAA